MADTAIAIEAPEVNAQVADPAVSDQDAAVSSAAGEAESTEGKAGPEPGKPGAAGVTPYEPAILNGRLSKSAYQALGEIKKSNPRFAAEIKAALFDAHNMRQALPQGLKEVEELRGQLEELGGVQAIQQSREELAYFNDLDSQFTAGDPRFLQAMVETPEGQAGFLKLAPSMLEKYREMAPEHHAAYIAKQAFQGAVDADLKLTLLRMQDVIAEVHAVKPELAERLLHQWQPLAGYYNGLAEGAAKKVDLPQIAKPAPAGGEDREQQLNQREEGLVKQDWRSAADGERLKIFNAEWARLTKDLKLNGTQAAAIKELYASRLQRAMANVPKFNETAQRYFANRDKDGFIRHTSSTLRQLIPGQLRAAIDAVVSRGATGTTPARQASQTAPAQSVPGGGAKAAAGFSWVAGAPKPASMKTGPGGTTTEMIRQGKAILTDGRKVQWRVA